ncbi:hypothetical protein D4758_22565 [Enterocloster citroniae]|nr:hypothetical protein [Enterocloster citroniae]
MHRHHIFGGKNRKWSEKYGLTVHLCPRCHTDNKEGVHADAEIMEALHRIGQAAFEKEHRREGFIWIFGKNYLPERSESREEDEEEDGIIWINEDDI